MALPGPDVKIDHIRTFLEISDCGNFNRAAENLHVTQSTVSARVKAMEERFFIAEVPVDGRRADARLFGDFTHRQSLVAIRQVLVACARQYGVFGATHVNAC